MLRPIGGWDVPLVLRGVRAGGQATRPESGHHPQAAFASESFLHWHVGLAWTQLNGGSTSVISAMLGPRLREQHPHAALIGYDIMLYYALLNYMGFFTCCDMI